MDLKIIRAKENYEKAGAFSVRIEGMNRAYNISLKETLPLYGIEVIEIPRFLDREGHEISAKVVRRNFEDEKWTELDSQIPESTVKVLKLIKDRGERE